MAAPRPEPPPGHRGARPGHAGSTGTGSTEATTHLPRRPHCRRTHHVPLVGRIAAGGPILAEQAVEDVLTLPRQLTGDGDLFCCAWSANR
jgi:repressor LexA